MSEMRVKTVGAKFIVKSHGNLDTLTTHARKTLSEIANFHSAKNKGSLKCQSST